MAHTTESLLANLRAAGIAPGDSLLVHSSYKSIGPVAGGGPAVLAALKAAVGPMGEPQGLLLLPTHTWREVPGKTTVFDVRTTPSCVGYLTELFRSDPTVVRTLHPTHSLGVWGAGAMAYAAGEEDQCTPCGPRSAYGRLFDRNAWIMLVGTDFSTNTIVHCIEEIARVPGRLSPQPMKMTIIDHDGRPLKRLFHTHHGADSDLYVKLQPVLARHGLLRQVPLGDATCYLMRARALLDATMALLGQDMDILGNDAPVPEALYAGAGWPPPCPWPPAAGG